MVWIDLTRKVFDICGRKLELKHYHVILDQHHQFWLNSYFENPRVILKLFKRMILISKQLNDIFCDLACFSSSSMYNWCCKLILVANVTKTRYIRYKIFWNRTTKLTLIKPYLPFIIHIQSFSIICKKIIKRTIE